MDFSVSNDTANAGPRNSFSIKPRVNGLPQNRVAFHCETLNTTGEEVGYFNLPGADSIRPAAPNACLESNGGSCPGALFYADNDLDGFGDVNKPYPGQVEREVMVRKNGLRVGDGASVRGVVARTATNNDGAASFGNDVDVSQSLFAFGGKHNVYIGSGRMTDVIAYDASDFAPANNPVVAYTPIPDGRKIHWKRTFAIMPNMSVNISDAFYGHGADLTANYDSCIIEQSAAINVHGFGVAEADNYLFRNNFGRIKSLPIAWGGKMDTERCQFEVLDNSGSGTVTAPMTLQNVAIFGVDSGYRAYYDLEKVESFKVKNVSVAGPGFRTLWVPRDDASGEFEIHYSVFTKRTVNIVIPGPNSTYTGDFNVFHNHSWSWDNIRWTYKGQEYPTLLAWQDATGQDLNSVYLTEEQAANFWLGDPSTGDFRINPDAQVTGADGTVYTGTFADGITPLTDAGVQEHWDYNSRSIIPTPPVQWPVFPGSYQESIEYIKSPTGWDFKSGASQRDSSQNVCKTDNNDSDDETYDYYVVPNEEAIPADVDPSRVFSTIDELNEQPFQDGLRLKIVGGAYRSELDAWDYSNVTIDGGFATISAGEIASCGWTQPDAETYPNVWEIIWQTDGPIREQAVVVFNDSVPTQLSSTAEVNDTPFSFYMDDRYKSQSEIVIQIYSKTDPNLSCTAPPGYVSQTGDPDDNDATVNPSAAELCDGKDNDGNGLIDDGLTTTTFYADTDGDGFGDDLCTVAACAVPMGYVSQGGDCNDRDALAYPGQKWYFDADMDGYPETSEVGCSRPTNGYAAEELVSISIDNCVNVYNPDQADSNNDGIGNACETTATKRTSISIGNHLSVAPNPVADHSQARVTGFYRGAIELGIYNAWGALVSYQRTFKNDSELQIELRTNNLPAGLYILKTHGELELTTRFVKH